MATPFPPALDPVVVEEIQGSGYPEPFRSRMGDRVKQRLGDACGLTQIGIHRITLGLGGQSGLRHWHTLKDEFIYILSVGFYPDDDLRWIETEQSTIAAHKDGRFYPES